MKLLRKVPSLFLLIAIVAISSASLLIRVAQQNFPSTFIAAMRLLIAGLIVLPLQMKKKLEEMKKINGKGWVSLLLSSLFLSFHFIFWITSLETSSVITSVVLVTTTPIWVALLSPIFLNERLSKRFYIGLFVAFLGIVILILSSLYSLQKLTLLCELGTGIFKESALYGSLLALMGAFCAAGYVMSGRNIRKTISNITYVSFIYLASGLFCIIYFLTNPSNSRILLDWGALAPLVLLAVIPQLIGHSLVNAALGYLPAAHVSLGLLGEPIGSVLLAFLFMNEVPSIMEGFGAVVIMIGIYIAVKKNTKPRN